MIEDDSNEILISLASIWELAIKSSKGKLALPGSSATSLLEYMDAVDYVLLPINASHILRMETLPHHHGDPFDRMLVAQAIEEDLTLLTPDSEIPLYSVKVVWN